MTFLVDTITLDWPCDNSFTSTPSLLSHPRSAGGRADSNGRRSACRLQKGRRSHDCRLAWSVSLPCRRGNGRAFMMVEVFPLPTLPTSLCSTSLSSEFTTSLTHHSSAFNAQNHTETSLALLPSCGESLLVDSMCCVASLGLLVPSIETPWSQATRYGRHRLPDCFNAAEPCHQPAKKPVPSSTATRLSKHEPTHMEGCVRLSMRWRCWCVIGLWWRPIVPLASPGWCSGVASIERFNASEPRPRNVVKALSFQPCPKPCDANTAPRA
jgi:hypothetical protein